MSCSGCKIKGKTKMVTPTDDWLSYIFRGNYICISVNFLKSTEVMNTEFIAFHGNDFNVENKIFDKLIEIVCKKV